MDVNSISLRTLFSPIAPPPPPSPRRIHPIPSHSAFRSISLRLPATQQSKEQASVGGSEDADLPPEFHNEEWQARQREKTKEWHAYRKKEEEEENRKVDEYREIGTRLKSYPEEEVREARKLISSFIRSAEEVEEGYIKAELALIDCIEIFYFDPGHTNHVNNTDKVVMQLQSIWKIEEAAEKGELSELVLMVIWNRLDLARRDDEKDVIRSLDLLYRRIETEILKRESSPAMRLLNGLLNLHDGFDDDEWLKKCRKCMIDIFPREDPFSMLVPAGFDVDNHQGPMKLPPEDDDVLLRVDFVRELDALLQEVRAEQNNPHHPEELDPESVAAMLKQQEKLRSIRQVETLLDLAISLKW